MAIAALDRPARRQIAQRGAEGDARDAEQIGELLLRRAHRHPVGGVGGHRREQPRQPFGDGQPPFGIDDVERHGKLAAETAQQQLGPADVGGHQRAKHRAVDSNQPRRTAGNRIDLALQPGEEGQLAENIARP